MRAEAAQGRVLLPIRRECHPCVRARRFAPVTPIWLISGAGTTPMSSIGTILGGIDGGARCVSRTYSTGEAAGDHRPGQEPVLAALAAARAQCVEPRQVRRPLNRQQRHEQQQAYSERLHGERGGGGPPAAGRPIPGAFQCAKRGASTCHPPERARLTLKTPADADLIPADKEDCVRSEMQEARQVITDDWKKDGTLPSGCGVSLASLGGQLGAAVPNA